MFAGSRGALAMLFIVAGTAHFISPAPYLAIVPYYFPWPAAMVALSGVAEILGGVGVCFRATRRAAGWWLIALLIAVFPANIHAISTRHDYRRTCLADLVALGAAPLSNCSSSPGSTAFACARAIADLLEPFQSSFVRALVKLLLLPLLVAPTLLLADGLTDVRAALQKLQSDPPLRARVEIKTRHSGGESNKQKQSESVSSVIVESGAEGLKLSWSPDQIKQSRKAAWAETANPDAPKSDIAMLKALEAGHALNLLDAADPLRRGLERARLLEDKSDTYKGNRPGSWSFASSSRWTKKSARR